MKFNKFNVSLSILALGLFSVGLMALYSSAIAYRDIPIFWKNFGLAGIAILVWIIFTFQDYHFIAKQSRWIYLVSIAVLVLTLLFGERVRGAQRWLGAGQIRFQTAELAKLAVTLGLAKWLYSERGLINTVGLLARTLIFSLVPVSFIILQPDFGSAMTIVAIWAGLLLVSRAKLKIIAVLAAIGLLAAVGAWQYVLHDFQKSRILVFLDPEMDKSGRSYNATQAIIAVGSGGLFGKGLGQGAQSQLNFLPERRTDFAFASIAEELGAVGAIAVVLMYAGLLYKIWIIAKRAKDDLGSYMSLGIWWWFFFQGTVNIGMNLGVLPVTGIPLPFVSYGGSSLVVSAACLGLLNNISWQTKT